MNAPEPAECSLAEDAPSDIDLQVSLDLRKEQIETEESRGRGAVQGGTHELVSAHQPRRR